MSDRVMAARTHNAFRAAMCAVAINGSGDAFVTMATGALHHLMIELSDLDGVWIFAGCEVERMPKPVVCLHRIFPNDVMRSVAVVAGGGVVVAGLYPSVVLLPHHVAVDARRRVVSQIAVTLGIDERVSADADDDSDRNGEDQRCCSGT